MPANTQPTRRSSSDTAPTGTGTDRESAPPTESRVFDDENVKPAERTGTSADAQVMFDSADVVFPNLFDRNNALIAPETE